MKKRVHRMSVGGRFLLWVPGRWREITCYCQAAVLPACCCSGQQFVHLPEQRLRGRYITVEQIIIDRIPVELTGKAGDGQEGFDFGGEGERLTVVIKIKRFFTETVAGQKEGRGCFVPDSEGEHAPEVFNAPSPVRLIGR